ncbi:MAG TPA: glycoside hydrolase family 38 C-terminal domain-containing protein, partial [Candidatus Lokiarchaeia archaeon]|nr:glycoside hydrolase family 38 C-terminal domain-containing protein [Candidatus Lokiarchaeia archaeon]
WNNYNPFPFNYFYWQGPDGSKVLCHNFQANWMGIVKWRDIHLRSRIPKEPGLVFSYANSPEEVEASLTKEYIKAFPIFYGLGDGGMGPLEEEVGMATALARGYHAKFTNMLTFFKRDLEPILKNTPTWNDEMYLELHRGIYTSHAKMKKLNRDAECSLLNAETLSTLATLVDPAALYPTEILDRTWKTTLFNQFHDILPGSSIPEVYLEAEPALAGVIQSGHTIAQTQLRVLGDNAPVGLPDSNVLGSAFVFNPLPWARDDVQEITFYDVPELPADVSLFDALGNEHDVLGISRTGETIKISARLHSFPAVGGRWVHLVANEKVVPELSWTELPDETYYIATPNYNAKVSKKTGLLISLVLVATGKELLTGPANKVKIYRDFPKKYPAWDINSTYTRRRCPDPVVQSVKLEQLSKSMVRVVVQEQTNHAKTMTQTITFNAGSPCIFLSFDADWTQKYDVVKVSFPLNTDAHFLTGEIPFGNIDRPLKPRNRFEVTKWEFPAFRWVDLSSEDNSGGVAVINNSKYGFSNRGSMIAMTLLRTSKYPYSVLHSFIQRIPSRKYPKHFDLERHHVEYAIFPHADSWRDAEVWRKAIEFNFPCIAPAGPQELPTGNGDQLAGELISGGLIVAVTPNFRVTAIKLPEDAAKLPAKTLIIRGVEVCGNDGPIEIEFHENLQVQDAQEVDLLELNPAPADASGSKIHFNCGKYEIKTFQITLA